MRTLLVLALVLSACASSPLIEPFAIDAPLPEADPAALGIDGAVLEAVADQIDAEDGHRVHSILVVRNGQVAFERYFNGFTRDTPHDLRSVTKSLTSLLVGIAIDRGHIESEDATLMPIVGGAYPDVTDKDDLTLRHLLTMRSGLDCDDGDWSTRGQEDRMYRTRDWVRTFLELERPYAADDTTRYCTGGVVALGEAIAQASGRDAEAFAAETLFGPLGIENARWARFDGDRKVDTGGHLLLTPQGLAKIGVLVLDDGRWGDRQIVSEAWLARSTRAATTLGGEDYGYLWRTLYAPYGGKTVAILAAQGNGGQSLFIVPEFDLVTVIAAGYYNRPEARIASQILYNAVLPSLDGMRPYVSTG